MGMSQKGVPLFLHFGGQKKGHFILKHTPLLFEFIISVFLFGRRTSKEQPYFFMCGTLQCQELDM